MATPPITDLNHPCFDPDGPGDHDWDWESDSDDFQSWTIAVCKRCGAEDPELEPPDYDPMDFA